MAIDACQYSFSQLASEVLPRHMSELRRQMKCPIPMSEFATEGAGIAAVRRRLKRSSGFKGCYVLLDGTRPIYVGILRGLNVAFIEIQNALERYVFEAYCAMELNSSQWNTFETH